MKSVLQLAGLVVPIGVSSLAGAAEPNTFVASGIGRAVAQPDIVFLRIGFKSEGQTPEEALKADAESARRVADVLIDQGLQPNDLETNGYAIEEIMGPEGCGNNYGNQPFVACTLEGYRLNNSITMRIRHIEDYGPILSGAIAAGLKDIGNITFAVSDEQKYYDEAFAKALLAAKAKAELTAKTLGFQLGDIVDVGANIAPSQFDHEAPATLEDGLGDSYPDGEADLMLAMPLAHVGEMTFTREASITFEIIQGT